MFASGVYIKEKVLCRVANAIGSGVLNMQMVVVHMLIDMCMHYATQRNVSLNDSCWHFSCKS